MKILLRVATLGVAMAATISLIAQNVDAKEVLRSINEYRAAASAEARANNTPFDANAVNAEVKRMAVEATQKVEVSAIAPADAYDWAQVFFIAQRYEETCELCEKFIKSKPAGAAKFQAQMLMMNACNAQGEADMILMTLATTEAPGWNESQMLARQVVGSYSATIAKEKGVDAAIKAIDSAEQQVIFEDPAAYAARNLPAMKRTAPKNRDGSDMTDEQILASLTANGKSVNDSLKFSFVRRKAELLADANRKPESLAMLDAFVKSLEPSNPLVRSAQTYRSQLTLTGGMAPPLSFERKYGDYTSLADLKGKVVLLQFTAHWCGPCKASYPDVRKVYDELGSKGLEVVMITRFYGYYGAERDLTPDQEYAKMEGFLKDHNLIFPMLFTSNDMFTNYGVSGIPHMALVGRDGTVKAIQVGYSAPSFAEFRKKIEAELNASN